MSDSNDNAIEWEEPPPIDRSRNGRPIQHVRFAEDLREKPGQWAVFKRGVTSRNSTTDIKTGRMKAFLPQGAFEARSATVADGYDIYARFVGDDK